MKALLIGFGEVGKAINSVFGPHHNITIYDNKVKFPKPKGKFKMMLVTIPYSNLFENIVKGYQMMYGCKHIIVFSTVPIGTCKKLGAVHSPVEGKHPNLREGVAKHMRWVGGEDPECIKFIREAGLSMRLMDRPEHTEFLKLRSTSVYGLNIEFARYSAKIAEEIQLPFHHVKMFDKDYNKLYKDLKMPQFQRYILDPPEGEIGGHCVVPNAKILDRQYPSKLLKEIYDRKKS